MTPETGADTEEVNSGMQRSRQKPHSFGKGVGSELSRKFKERRIR
jgi:hypothetical protein